jgi:hypothetical protein
LKTNKIYQEIAKSQLSEDEIASSGAKAKMTPRTATSKPKKTGTKPKKGAK